ncbi:O-linked N-acetylglucosamine transferase, SPINDLY family protein [Gellertiella hungarica]|uniref:Putative O-linked N-acetylglucosamine transferase (SPINDLY family) n=1 Tax=Gellertiella hungarica TaxID=1572859 RepID=A0A7W6J8W1_9HYPH|nr:hypothetical protein [Gellertiella hungarica]MBB4066929.1 putative O-linked N-acetylglucosamine transferase (SPINDLY family) [Gellertiella hungarica]
MSATIQEALDYYRAGNYPMVMSHLLPLLRDQKKVEPTLALVLAQSCLKLDQISEAAHWYDRASSPTLPNVKPVQLLAANLYIRLKNHVRAYEITKAMLKADPGELEALRVHRNCLRTLLLLDEIEASDRQVEAMMASGHPGIFDMEKPLEHVFWSENEAYAARLTKIDNGAACTSLTKMLRRARPHAFADRIRVAYVSNDLSDRHATMRLLQGVLLQHDRSAFDIHILCHTDAGLKAVDEGMRWKLKGLHDISRKSDDDVVAMLREAEIDILVDLKGHTKDARPGIVNLGAAPIQVAWLGFPGINTGLDCDYMIGDAVVTPEESQPLWEAKFCRLPETYQPNDDRYRALPPPAERAALGLPEDRIVLASFNSQLKITPRTFRLWMEILRQAPDTVLWAMVIGDEARDNARRAAKKAGIDPARLIFADVADYPSHVARLQAADAALDTFPCNGHTTTSDKLWAGLPLVTRKGASFASRVSESLLKALGFPELVAETDAEYIALNLRLATDHAWRASLKSRIAEARFRAPLFDTERFTRHLEEAYRMMVERARNGLPPGPIDVPPLPPRTGPFRT